MICSCNVFFAQKYNLLPDSISYCFGDSAFVEVKLQLDNNAIISWSTPQGIITNTRRIQALRSGKYSVKVLSAQFPGTITDSCMVRINYKVKPLLRDTFICKGKKLLLDARNTGSRFLWNTGETTSKIMIESPGRYWVKIMSGSCVTVDTVIIKQVQESQVSLPAEAIFCMNEDRKILNVKVSPGTKILWSNGANTSSVQVLKEGQYWVRTESKNCGGRADSIRVKFKVCDCEMIIPGSFSPNEDNKNDYFFPVLQCEYSYYNLTISDRWGNNVFVTNSVNSKWDGRFKGNLCPEDIYIYKIESTERQSEKKQVRNGKISLFR